jgi:hypothetical protein
VADVAQEVIILELGRLNVTVHEMLAWLRSAHHRYGVGRSQLDPHHR